MMKKRNLSFKKSGSKKGIVEVADAIVVNKSDGDLEKAARATASDYSAALGLARRKLSCWAPPVLRCSALRSEGIDQVWEQVVKFRSLIEGNGLLGSRRKQQAAHWMRQHLRQQLMDRAVADAEVQTLAKSLEIPLAFGKLSPRAAAERLVDCLLGDDNNGNTTTSGNSNIHSGNRTR
ncbi:arginine/ornithine transport system ATPase [Ectocarpus siliculosus]|uniref:Arginine/ornithine transport system ATPase n=1 Tax=Ectocarpus siliculosus TaxID=2880 RepID=D7G5D9_ECTSI|nr:arginine/ornithine transport system ATPase [Ectocarpus siliculosus]|eukprot:CBJ33833.1 arginine/ornithine transport system ATPase [Ectocarpus siliculosus]